MSKRWFFRVHALQRIAEMEVARQRVIDVLNTPDMDIPSVHEKYRRQGFRMAFAQDIVVVYRDDEVVTVLVRCDEKYLDRERDAREIRERLAKARETCQTGAR